MQFTKFTSFASMTRKVIAFQSVPRGFWTDMINQRTTFEEFRRSVNINDWQEWYKISRKQLMKDKKLRSLIQNRYGGSYVKALMSIYPEYEWNQWKFGNRVTGGYWAAETKTKLRKNGQSYSPNEITELKTQEGLKHQREFFEKIGKQLNISKWEDWYEITARGIVAVGGRHILNYYYRGSSIQALMTIYPELPWKIWKFKNIPRNFYEEDSNLVLIMDSIYKELKMNSPEDWYKVGSSSLGSMGYKSVMQKNGGLYAILCKVYPNYKWDVKRFTTSKIDKSQYLLHSYVNYLIVPILSNKE